MGIDPKFKLAILLPFLLFTGFQCTNNSKLLEQVPSGDFVDSCPDVMYEFGEMVSVGDPSAKFLIRLPYSWDIRESYSDSLYGVFSSNFLSIPKPMAEQMAVSVSGYESDKTTEQYFRDEVIELVKASDTRVMERGTTMISGLNCPWVLFEMTDGIYSMVYYVKNPERNDIYLIQTVSYDTVNYKVKMCYLKQLVNSFEVIRF